MEAIIVKHDEGKNQTRCACFFLFLPSPLPRVTSPTLPLRSLTSPPSTPHLSSTGQAGFIRYTILVTLRDQTWSIVRRFNDFAPLHEALCRSFPRFPGRLPIKKWFGRFNADFLRERKVQLQHYLDAVTSLPKFPESSREGCIFFEVGMLEGGRLA